MLEYYSLTKLTCKTNHNTLKRSESLPGKDVLIRNSKDGGPGVLRFMGSQRVGHD